MDTTNKYIEMCEEMDDENDKELFHYLFDI